MAKLDDRVRMMLEKNIDTVIDNPEGTELSYRSMLTFQGIEPNLETVLSYLVGMLIGAADGSYVAYHQRLMSSDERMKVLELLKRRAFELRQAFLRTRIEE